MEKHVREDLEASQTWSYCVLNVNHPLSISVYITSQKAELSIIVQNCYWSFIIDAWLIQSLAMKLNSIASSLSLPPKGHADITELKAPNL